MKYRILSICATGTIILPPSYKTQAEASADCDRLRGCPDVIEHKGSWFTVAEDKAEILTREPEKVS